MDLSRFWTPHGPITERAEVPRGMSGKPSWVLDPSRPPGGTKSTFGAQPLSTRSSVQTYSFGTSQRFSSGVKMFISEAHSRHQLGQAPGPGTYKDYNAATGPQASSVYEQHLGAKFGKASRFGELCLAAAVPVSTLSPTPPSRPNPIRVQGAHHEGSRDPRTRLVCHLSVALVGTFLLFHSAE